MKKLIILSGNFISELFSNEAEKIVEIIGNFFGIIIFSKGVS